MEKVNTAIKQVFEKVFNIKIENFDEEVEWGLRTAPSFEQYIELAKELAPAIDNYISLPAHKDYAIDTVMRLLNNGGSTEKITVPVWQEQDFLFGGEIHKIKNKTGEYYIKKDWKNYIDISAPTILHLDTADYYVINFGEYSYIAEESNINWKKFKTGEDPKHTFKR